MSSSKNKNNDFNDFVKSIENSNERFAKASSAQKIVMVAKDVLKLLALKRITSSRGSYVETGFIDEALFKGSAAKRGKFSDIVSASELFKLPELPECTVCAIGGAMVAATMRLNDCDVNVSGNIVCDYYSYGNPVGMSARADEVFGDELLREMESAFEQGTFEYHRLKSDSGRLKAIYENLVENKGKKFTFYKGVSEVWPVRSTAATRSIDPDSKMHF